MAGQPAVFDFCLVLQQLLLLLNEILLAGQQFRDPGPDKFVRREGRARGMLVAWSGFFRAWLDRRMESYLIHDVEMEKRIVEGLFTATPAEPGFPGLFVSPRLIFHTFF